MVAWAQSVHSPDGEHALISGTPRRIAKTGNGGSLWEQVVIPDPLGSMMLVDSLAAAWMLDENTFVVAGHNFFETQEIIIRSSNGGAAWTIVQLGPDFTGFDDIHFTDATDGVVIGQQGRILRTTDAGVSWSNVPSPTTRWLHDLVFLDDQLGYACGDEVCLITEDGGISWQQLPVHACDARDLAVGTPDVLYLSGEMPGGGRSLLRSANGGQTWLERSTPFDPEGAVYAFGTDTVFVAANEGLYASFDQGVTWFFFQETEGHWIQDIKFHDFNSAYAVGAGTTVFRTSNRGGAPRPVAWYQVSDPSPCPGAVVQFTDLSPPGLAYEWSVDGSIVSTAFQFSHVFAAPGAHEVQLVVLDGPQSDTVRSDVNVLDTAIVTPFTVQVGPDSVCEGESIAVNINSQAGHAYRVRMNGLVISDWTGHPQAGGVEYYDVGAEDAVIEVVGRAISYCDTAYFTVTDTVQVIPLADPIPIEAQSELICVEDSPMVTLMGTDPGVLYHLTITYTGTSTFSHYMDIQGNGGDIPVAFSPMDGMAVISCSGENMLGCDQVFTDVVNIAVDTVLARFRSEPAVAFVDEPVLMIDACIGDLTFWDFGPGSAPPSSVSDSVLVTFTGTELHHPVIMGVENATGCSLVDTLEITILAHPDAIDAPGCRLDSTGHHFGLAPVSEHVLDFAVDATGNRIITGLWRNSYGDYYGHSAFLSKYDREGQLLWEHRAPILNDYRSSAGGSLAVDAAGNIYMSVHFYNVAWQFAGDIFGPDESIRCHQGLLLKFSPDGTLLWSVHCDDGARGISDVLIMRDGTIRFAVYGLPENIEFADGTEEELWQCCGPKPVFFIVHVDTAGHFIDVLDGPLDVGTDTYAPEATYYFPIGSWGVTSYWQVISPTLFETCDGRIGFVDHMSDSVQVAGQGFEPDGYYYMLVAGISDEAGAQWSDAWRIAQHGLDKHRPWAVPDEAGTGLIVEMTGSYRSDTSTVRMADGTVLSSRGAGCLLRLDMSSGAFDWLSEMGSLTGTKLERFEDGTFAYLGTAAGHVGITSQGSSIQGLAPLDEGDIVLVRFDGAGNVLSMNAFGSEQVDLALGMALSGGHELAIAGVAGGPIDVQGIGLNDPDGIFLATLSLDGDCDPLMEDGITLDCCGDTITLCEGDAAPLVLTWSMTGTSASVSIWWSAPEEPGQHPIVDGYNAGIGHFDWNIPDSLFENTLLTVVVEGQTGAADTVTIMIGWSPSVGLVASATTACLGDTIHLTAQAGMTAYLWQDSIAGGATFIATASGEYSVEVIPESGCTATDDIVLAFLPIDPWPSADTLVCDNVPAVLSVPEGFDQYLWSNGATGQSTIINVPGPVTVQAWLDTGCLVQDTIDVVSIAAPGLEVIVPTPPCIGGFLHATSSVPVSHLWDMGSILDSAVVVSGTHTYWVKGTSVDGCVGTDTVLVTGIDCDVGLLEFPEEHSISANLPAGGTDLFVTWEGRVDRIELRDPLGRLLAAVEVYGARREVHLALDAMAAGPFILRAIGPEGTGSSISLFKP